MDRQRAAAAPDMDSSALTGACELVKILWRVARRVAANKASSSSSSKLELRLRHLPRYHDGNKL